MEYTVLFVTCLLLLNQHLVSKTFSFVVESDENDIDEEIVDTTERTVSNGDDSHDTAVIKNRTSTSYNKLDVFGGSPQDIIELNVGGERLTTLRSTLTAVPGSKLALMFTEDGNTKKKAKSKNYISYFFDYNPIQFAYLLDQLREIKRIPNFSPTELDIKPPVVDARFNFSNMINELGLNPEYFLSPLVGVHTDLNRSSLVGWKKCYTARYNIPFNMSIFNETCKGKRLLVACRSIDDRKTLTVAGIGKRENLFTACSANSHCSPQKINRIGFYYVAGNVWGFEGRPQSWIDSQNYGYQYGYQNQQAYLNPCDSTEQYSEYRLCWSMPSGLGRGGGDRCGSEKNLHNSKRWERMIFEAS